MMVESLQAHLLPALIQRGFEPVRGGPVDRDSPLGRLIRVREPVVDQVEIELLSHGRAAFRINACPVPKEGMTTPGGHRTAEEVLALGVHDLEMYAWPRLFIFFSLFSMGLWRFRSPVQADYDKLALRVADLMPELESALREGKLGPHMRRLVFVAPATAENRPRN